MRALDETLLDLIKDLSDICIDMRKLNDIVKQWRDNYFEEFHIVSTIDLESEERGGSDLKAHLVRHQVIEAAVGIASKCAHGREEQKMPWDERASYRNIDYAPCWTPVETMPFKELHLSFVCLKRRPTSWYVRESEKEWLDKLVQP